jgi:hypothetical protein
MTVPLKYVVTVEVEMVIPEEDTGEWQTAMTMISAGQAVLRSPQRPFWGGFCRASPTGVEFVEAEVRKHSGERWNDLDIAMLFTGRLAPFRF